MWSSTSSAAKTATSIVLGGLCFNTHAELPAQIIEIPVVQTEKSGAAWLYSFTSQDFDLNNKSELNVVSVSEIIKRAKIQLGLPNKDLADVFLVSRQTIQTYLKGSDKSHAVNNQTKERALSVLKVLDLIEDNFGKSPGAMAKNYTVEDNSLLDLLSREELEVDKIIELSKVLGKILSNPTHNNLPEKDSALFDLTRSV